MNTPYHLVIYGEDGAIAGVARLNCMDDFQASCMAFCTASPFGHALIAGSRFLGQFEAALSNEEG